jgi:hypothetical protein
MIDSVAAVLGSVSAGIFLAHAIESYRAYALIGAEARFTPVKQGMSNDRNRSLGRTTTVSFRRLIASAKLQTSSYDRLHQSLSQ